MKNDVINIRDIIEEKKQKDMKFQQAYLNIHWNEVIGNDQIAQEIKILYIKNKIIFVSTENAGIKHYVNLNKKDILCKIFDICSFDIEDIVFRTNILYGG